MRLAIPVLPNAFLQIMLKKWTGLGTVSNSVLEKRLQFIKKVHPMNILTTTSLKIRKNFREFTTLVRKYYSDSNADYILTYAKLLQGQIWDDWIDSRLAILRDIDKNHRLFKPR